MKPMDIIQQFRLDTSSEKMDFLIAADCAEEHGFSTFAQFLRVEWRWLALRQSMVLNKHQRRVSAVGQGYGPGLADGRGAGAGRGLLADPEDDLPNDHDRLTMDPAGEGFGEGWGYCGIPHDFSDGYGCSFVPWDERESTMRFPRVGNGVGHGVAVELFAPICYAFGKSYVDGSGSSFDPSLKKATTPHDGSGGDQAADRQTTKNQRQQIEGIS